MRHILFIFLDGVGLGEDDPARNPMARAHLPTLANLLNGKRLVKDTPITDSGRALFIPTDAAMGIEGAPQSATGQATILTGLNVPALVGGHWGPKPNEAVSAILRRENIFISLTQRRLGAALINAYPQRYFDAVSSGRRMFSAIPMAVDAANIPLMAADDLRQGRAFSADFSGEGWRGELKYTDTPIYSLHEAGARLTRASQERPFTFFEHWMTDYAGHRGTMEEAVEIFERFDAVLSGVLNEWDDENGLVVITSDHGNVEDLSHNHHTHNPVPTLVVGKHRAAFAEHLTDLTGFAPAILKYLEP